MFCKKYIIIVLVIWIKKKCREIVRMLYIFWNVYNSSSFLSYVEFFWYLK